MTLPIIKKFLPSLQEKPWFVTLTEDYILSLPWNNTKYIIILATVNTFSPLVLLSLLTDSLKSCLSLLAEAVARCLASLVCLGCRNSKPLTYTSSLNRVIHLLHVDTILSTQAKKWIQVDTLQPSLRAVTVSMNALNKGRFQRWIIQKVSACIQCSSSWKNSNTLSLEARVYQTGIFFPHHVVQQQVYLWC